MAMRRLPRCGIPMPERGSASKRMRTLKRDTWGLPRKVSKNSFWHRISYESSDTLAGPSSGWALIENAAATSFKREEAAALD